MLPLIRSLIICAMLVSFCLSNEKYMKSTNELVGIVRNISVKVSQDQEYAERIDTYKFLKLNISWLPPPNNIKQPSSYSILVTGTRIKEKTSIAECPEGSLFHTLDGNEKLNVLVPEYNSSAGIPELYIQPNCSYKVQVFANPRLKYIGNATEVLYTVPKCIGLACSCTNVESTLPIPKVNITRTENEIVVNWSSTLNTSNIKFYVIRIGVPILMSRKGLPVYNITNIGQVSTDKTTFLWNFKSRNEHIEIKDGYKIIVNAIDYNGCSGPAGNIVIHSVPSNAKTVNHSIWFIWIGIITICILLGVLSIVLYLNQNFFTTIGRNNNSIGIRRISECKFQWMDRILEKRNILYIAHESKKEETNELLNQAPFKSVKLIRELGAGQFGKVYLGHLDDRNNTLVAVKMSQQIDVSTVSETRQQFIKEVEMMKMAGNHPHLINLVGYCIQPTKPICILLEYMQGGDLLTYLHHRRKRQSDKIIYNDQCVKQDLCKPDISESSYTSIRSAIPKKTNSYKCREYINIISNYGEKSKNRNESWIGKMKGREYLKFATEIAMGMEHLEIKGITHRDLAARNILLSTDLTVKISDFGLSRNGVYVIKSTEEKTRHLPIRWMSPEALYNRAFSSKSDVWSFGVVLWEMSTLGSFPYSNVSDDCLLRYIIRENGRLEQPEDVPSNIYKLMYFCWTTEPENRPNFTQLVSQLRILTTCLEGTLGTVSNPCYAFPFSNKIT